MLSCPFHVTSALNLCQGYTECSSCALSSARATTNSRGVNRYCYTDIHCTRETVHQDFLQREGNTIELEPSNSFICSCVPIYKTLQDETREASSVMGILLQNMSNNEIFSKTPITASLTFQASELTPCRTKVLIRQHFERWQLL